MTLLERLNAVLFKEKKEKDLSSDIPLNQISSSSNTDISGFFDEKPNQNNASDFLSQEKNIQFQQIVAYRNCALIPEVDLAVTEIVNEVCNVERGQPILKIQYTGDNKRFSELVQKEFSLLYETLNFSTTLHKFFQQFYVDGQLNAICVYDNKNIKRGIVRVDAVEPFIKFDKENNKVKIDNSYTLTPNFLKIDSEFEFSPEEFIHINSGIIKSGIIMSDLHNAVKISNILQSLENMLIPMRFSRSISRRVFNVDVSNMNASKAEEYLRKIQNVFKYKKYYDVEKGIINSQQAIANLVEDYWFPNRNGNKGTQVDTLNESLNLGEMGDIEYFQRKLFLALKVPIARLLGDNAGSGFSVDFNSTDTTRDEIRFMNFITRKRLQFSVLIKEIFKRQMLSKNLINERDYNQIANQIQIIWTSENAFLEKIKLEKYNNLAAGYREYEDLLEKGWVSKQFIYENILKFTAAEIEEIYKQKQEEKTNPIYKDINKGDDDESDDDNLDDDSDDENDSDNEPDENDDADEEDK